MSTAHKLPKSQIARLLILHTSKGRQLTSHLPSNPQGCQYYVTDLGRVISLRHEVQREEHREAQRREEQGGHQRALLPLPTLERLVEDGARVARRYPHEHVQQQHRHR